MIQTLKDLFTHFALPIAPDEDPAQAVQLAAAVLLVEVARSDATTSAVERQALLAALQRTFALAPAALERLMELATTTAHTAYDYQRFTGTLNAESFLQGSALQAQKIDLVEALWQVAYADDHLDAHEHHTISKVAGLLHVTHGEYIAAKMRAKEAAQAH